jgi:hypothetical protein
VDNITVLRELLKGLSIVGEEMMKGKLDREIFGEII